MKVGRGWHKGSTTWTRGGIWSQIQWRAKARRKGSSGREEGTAGWRGSAEEKESQRAGKGEQEGGVKWGGGCAVGVPFHQPGSQEPPCPLQAPAKEAARRLCFFNPWGLLTQISIAGQGSIGKALEVKT